MDWIKQNLFQTVITAILSIVIGLGSWLGNRLVHDIDSRPTEAEVLNIIHKENKTSEDKIDKNTQDIAIMQTVILTMKDIKGSIEKIEERTSKIDERTFEQGKDIEKIKGKFNID